MSPEMLRSLIQDVLRQEISLHSAESGAFADTSPKPQTRQESLSIDSDSELMDFVHRLLEIAKDGKARKEIESGRWVFKLQNRGLSYSEDNNQATATNSSTSCFERGLISERQIDSLGPQVEKIIIGRRALLTPLARDVLQTRNIEVEQV